MLDNLRQMFGPVKWIVYVVFSITLITSAANYFGFSLTGGGASNNWSANGSGYHK